MRATSAHGWQLAFLTFAAVLLAAPAGKQLVQFFELTGQWAMLWQRILPILILATGVIVAWVRSPQSLATMAPSLPDTRRLEVAAATVAHLAIPLAVAGAFAAWYWFTEGPLALEQRYQASGFHRNSEAIAFSTSGLILFLLVAPFVAPLVEEFIFRGFLYGAWKERWGWMVAGLLTSLVFAAYHRSFVGSFLSSVLFVCIYRRTGTLRGPMIVHAVGNLALFYPFYGQLVYPRPEEAVADITTWWPQLVALAFVVFALPIYVLMARHEHAREEAA